MLSAVVVVQDSAGARPVSAEAVVRTLSSLVPAAIEGLIRDVTLAASAGREGMRKIADHAGCELAEASSGSDLFRRGVEMARNPRVFVIHAGRAPESGFAEELSDFLSSGARAAVMRETPRHFLTRLAPSLSPVAALVASRDHLLKAAATDLAGLARHARPELTLRARARWVE